MTRPLRDLGDGLLGWWCPGCLDVHAIPTEGEGAWGYNDNRDAPTFTPSVRVSGFLRTLDADGRWVGGWERDAAGQTIPLLCHAVITDGQIQFLGDCTHALAGQTVPIPDMPAHLSDDIGGGP